MNRVRIQIYKFIIVFALTFFAKNFFGQSIVRIETRSFKLFADSLSKRQYASYKLGKDAYTRNLAFFCRQELKLEKALRIPVRMRMGSLKQCNYLEGKE
jgi:hypothetical protein